MAGTIPTYPPLLAYEAAFNEPANQAAVPLWFSDLSARTKTGPQNVQRGRQYELDTNAAGTWRTLLENKDGALDPSNAASPYAPNVLPYRACRIRAMTGVNLLTADQATAGEASGYGPGPVPAQFNINSGAGYTIAIAAAADAYQGAQVYQVAVPNGATSPKDLLDLTQIPVIPGAAYAAQIQARLLATAQNLNVHVSINWLDTSGNTISTTVGSNATLTGGSTTWVQIATAGTAPSGAYSATLRAVLGTTATATASFQTDGLQWEQAQTATPWQMPQTLAANQLPRQIATGSASMATGDSVANWFYSAAGSLAQATGLTAAPSGATTAVAWTSPAGTTNASPLHAGAAAAGASASGPVADTVQVTGGQTYTASVYMMRTSSADTTIQIQGILHWFDASGNPIGPNPFGTSTTISTGSWARITVSGTAPSNAAWGRPCFGIATPSTTTATNLLYATSWQMEAAASASPWMDPGPTGYIYGGLVERWPQTWLKNGTYGLVSAVGVDALAALAQYTLLPPFIQEVLGYKPDFFYALDDATGSTTFVDKAARKRAGVIATASPGGAGTGAVTPGSSITATSSSSGIFQGTPGPVTTITNPNPASNTGNGQGVAIDLAAGGVAGPPATGPWTRMIAFRTTVVPTGAGSSTIWWSVGPPGTGAAGIYVSTVAGGVMNLGIANTTDDYTIVATSTNVCDGNWHLVLFGIAADGLNFYAWVDGVAYSAPSLLGDDVHPTGIVRELLGSTFPVWGQFATESFQGDLAFAAQFPFLVTSAQVTNLYNSFRAASAGESSGARAGRVLGWIGWNGKSAIDTGQTTNMGPASDLTGATALDALNAIALTENGNLFASCSNAVTFTARTRRYQQLNPTLIFGENVSLGEWPYEDIEIDYDPQHLFNNIQVTHYPTGQVATAQDTASQSAYFPRILQRAINPALFTEAQDAAAYLLQQYKSARLRIANITLNASAVPGLFAALLQVEIGTRVRVMRRMPSAPTIQFDGFVEAVAWTIDPDTGKATVQLQCSPADLSSYWLLGALHTTLNAQALSGQNTAKINALPDSAVNALKQSLPYAQQLVFDPGTAIQETMTLASGGIPATNPGYSSATLTFTTNFANTHAANAIVCEPLPSGITDPTTYDTASVIGAASAQLVAASASGTNTITVGPLGDSKTNALASNWNTGDLLWISPGTANFEGYNLLHPNVSTAGEGAIPLPTGSNGNAYGVGAFYGTPTVTASGTAWQGANVWQTAVAGGAATGHTVINQAKVPVTANLPFAWSIYVRSATSSQNPQVHANIQWLDAGGNSLGSATGATVTLTGSPTASWTRLTVTGTAPVGAVWAAPAVFLDVAPASAWSFQADGLQLEQASAVSPYCTTPQVRTVAASTPGYSQVVITLNTNLINSHFVPDTVCDPLPAGLTAPSVLAATARLAY